VSDVSVGCFAELPGFTAQVNLSAAEIKRLADRIIAKSKETYDAVAAVPLDKVCTQHYGNIAFFLSALCFIQCSFKLLEPMCCFRFPFCIN
jgi:hypothetical protein